jgi:N-acetylneuraminic acid mutarotase
LSFAFSYREFQHLSPAKSKKWLTPGLSRQPITRLLQMLGPDQTISLPNNTVNLDGSASSDPENNITTYLWTKISGPSSFNIYSVSNKTQVTNLVQGVYLFELKVTDAGGLFSSDTVQLTVSNSKLVSGCNANLIKFGQLSRPARVWKTVAIGSKIFFGAVNETSITEIYDSTTQTWSTANLTFGSIIIGTKVIDPYHQHANNELVFEIYDVVTDSRTFYKVPEPRSSIKNCVTDNKVVFAGGFSPDSTHFAVSKRIDIYDNVTGSWSIANFKDAREGMTMVGLGNKIYFAGGSVIRYDSLILICDDDGNNCTYQPTYLRTDRIDIYDLSTHTWSVTQLKEPRRGAISAVVGNKIIFAGGGSESLEIYDAVTNTWSVMQVPPGTLGSRIHVVGNKVLFTALWSKTVGIYDVERNSWSTAQMSKPNGQTDYLVAVAGNKIVFFTVFDLENDSKNIDIYDASSNTWCHAELSFSLIRSGIVVVGNRVYIAGGISKSNPNGVYDTLMDSVWILDF